MRLKLTKAEMQSLEMWLYHINDSKPKGLYRKLLVALMIKLYEKVAKDLVVLKNKYSLKMDDATCLAFTLLFLEENLNPIYHADNLIIKLLHKFQQHYA